MSSIMYCVRMNDTSWKCSSLFLWVLIDVSWAVNFSLCVCVQGVSVRYLGECIFVESRAVKLDTNCFILTQVDASQKTIFEVLIILQKYFYSSNDTNIINRCLSENNYKKNIVPLNNEAF